MAKQPYPYLKTEKELSFMAPADLEAYALEVNKWNTEQEQLEIQRAKDRVSRNGHTYPYPKTEKELSFMPPDELQKWAADVEAWFAAIDKQNLQDAQMREGDMRRNQIAARKTYTSFSGADIVASIRTAGGKPVVFGEIQTITYSIHRPMTPVYALGRINPKGVVRGQRVIAGSMIFTVFDRHVLKNVMDTYRTQENSFAMSYGLSETDMLDLRQNAKTDEMPPFDINISFLNEYGNSATLNIYGIHITSEGQVMSIEDMITENTMQYIAMDIDLMDYSDRADYDTGL